jgi:hypothetical protein
MVIEAAQGELAGFNPVHMSESLAEADDPVELSARSVRRIPTEAGLRAPRTRRRRRHHARRERMAASGTLLQTDGSTEDWLEDRGPRLTLVGGIDDATSAITGATFRTVEDAAGYFAMLTQTVQGRSGLSCRPIALSIGSPPLKRAGAARSARRSRLWR